MKKLKILPLEERIVLDAAAAHDAAAPAHDAAAAAPLHILVLPDSIPDAVALAAAAKPNTAVVTYNPEHMTLGELATKIAQGADNHLIDSIAFATDGKAGAFNLTSLDTVNSEALGNSNMLAFWHSVANILVPNGQVDILSCNVTSDQAGQQLISQLESIINDRGTQIGVYASSDTTGNSSIGGNWVLEYQGNRNVSDIYFDSTSLMAWNHSLATAGIQVTYSPYIYTAESGTTATFSVVLTSAPTANVTIGLTSSDTTEGTLSVSSLTFTTGNWNIAQTVTINPGGSGDGSDGDQYYSIITAAAVSTDANYSGLNARDIPLINIDRGTKHIVVLGPNTDYVNEAGTTATFQVVLSRAPSSSVTIGVTSSDTSEGTVSTSSLVFTTSNWATPQSVTVTGVNDALLDGDMPFKAVLAAATSFDGTYNGQNPSDPIFLNVDNEINRFVFSSNATRLYTTENGDTATYSVALSSQPSANVTVNLYSADTTVGVVSTNSLVFTNANWSTPQEITITGVNNASTGNLIGTVVGGIATSTDSNWNGVKLTDVSFTNIDNDTSNVNIIRPSYQLAAREQGAGDYFQVVLNKAPTSNVTVSFSQSSPLLTLSSTSLTFSTTNWMVPRTVSFTAVNNATLGDTLADTISTTTSSSDATYNALSIPTFSIVHVDDDAAGGYVANTTNMTTEYGDTQFFYLWLQASTTGNLTINLSSSDTTEGVLFISSTIFNTGNTDLRIPIFVKGVDDALLDGNIAYTIVTTVGASPPSPYTVSTVIPDASLTNFDNDIYGFVISPVSGLTTTEAGGTAQFTVKLATAPVANVTLPISSSNTGEGTVSTSSLIFTPVNWNVNQTVTITGVDDFIVDGNIAYSVVTGNSTSTDIHYNNINPQDVSVTNQDNDTAGITVTPTSGLVTTEAGGTAQFSVVLDSQPTANVTIGISSSNTAEGTTSVSSLTFTAGNWNTPQFVTVTGVDDFVVDGSIGYTIVTGPASSIDLNYSGLNASDVSVTNQDNDTAGINVTPVSGLITTEAGGTAQFSVTLNSQPTANVTIGISSSNTAEGTTNVSSLTFTAGNWNVAQFVTITGVDDLIDDGDSAYTIVTAPATSSDLNYNGLDAADVSVTNQDDDTAGITVTPTSGLVTTEGGGTAQFTVNLNTQPTANVTIGISSSNVAEGTPDFSLLTFTPSNWNTPQTVPVTGVDDFIIDGSVGYTIITAPASSTDGNYNGMDASDVSVTNQDNDTAGINITPTSGLITTEAGGTAQFSVTLNSQPSANVTFGLSSSNTGEGTPGVSSLTFTPGNWNTPQFVTITGVNDFVDDGDIAYTIITASAVSSDVNYNGLDASDVSVTNQDDDTAGITVSPTSGLVTTEGGGTAQFTVQLDSQPTANVTIGVSSSNTGEGTPDVSSLTFTPGNWNVAQTVTVTGINDFIIDGNSGYTIVTAPATSTDTNYNGVDASDVSVTNQDDDTAGINVTPVSGLVTTEAGGTTQFSVTLNSQPAANVIIGISSSDTTEGTTSVSTLTFTPGNWNVAQIVTVTGVNDFVADGNIAYTIITSPASSADGYYNGLNAADVSVTNQDDDAAGIFITPVSGLTTTEGGGTAQFYILLDSQPTSSVSIAISSSNPAEGTPDTSVVTFTPFDWNLPYVVTITGVDDFVVDGNIPYTIITGPASSLDSNYNGVDASDVSVTNQDDDTAGINVSPTSGLVTTEAGGTAQFSITLNSQPTANVTIGIASSNTGEGTPDVSSLVFTPANWNIAQTVTVTGIDDAIDDGNVAYTIVTAPASSADGNYSGLNTTDVSVTNQDNDTAGINVTPTSGLITTEGGGTAQFSVTLNSQPTATVTIGISTSNAAEGTPDVASLTFTAGNWNVAQTVTITGVDDFVVDGNVGYTIFTAPATSSDTNYSGLDAADVSVTNQDNDSVGVIVSPISGLVTTEAGGTAQFTVKLNSQPTANVVIGIYSDNTAEGTPDVGSLTFTTLDWNTPQTVTITGVNDFIVDGNVPYTIVTVPSLSLDPNYIGVDGSDVSVTNMDDDVAGITVSPTSGLITTEAGGSTQFSVVLDSQPIANVIIGVSSSNTAEGTTNVSSLTFTPGNWNTPQFVTVTGVNDFVDDGDVGYSIVTAPATSSDANYSGMNASDIGVTNQDDDTAGITVSPTSGLVTTEAGGTAQFTVVLDSQPTANVTIGIASNTPSEGTTDVPSLTFTPGNWNTPQTVTITGVDDAIDDGDVAYLVVTAPATSTDLTYSGIDASDVNVTNQDNDTAGITVTPTSGLVTTEAGGTTQFSVVLDSQPTANVTIGLLSDTPTEGIPSLANITFTPSDWNTPQFIIVNGVDDFINDGDIAYNIMLTPASSGDSQYNGMTGSSVALTNLDNDIAAITVTPTSGLITTEAGGSAQFNIFLDSQPLSNVTIAVSSSNTAEGIPDINLLTFTPSNWNVAQTVTVIGVSDLVVDGDVNYHINVAAATSSDPAYNGLTPSDVSVKNLDLTPLTPSIPPPSSIARASPPTPEMRATSEFGNYHRHDVPQPLFIDSNAKVLSFEFPGFTLDHFINLSYTPEISLSTQALSDIGDHADLSINLNHPPSSPVTIYLALKDPASAQIENPTVTFDELDWNKPQKIRIVPLDPSQDILVILRVESSNFAYNGVLEKTIKIPAQVKESPIANTRLPLSLMPDEGMLLIAPYLLQNGGNSFTEDTGMDSMFAEIIDEWNLMDEAM